MGEAARKKKSTPPPESDAKPKRHLPVVKQVSASNAEAFVMCGASHVLPQSDSHNDYMYRGSEGHEPLAATINNRTPKTTDRGVMLVKDFPLGKILEGTADRKAEVAYAVNVQTKSVRYIGQDVGREYGPLEKYEVPCTLDVRATKGGRPWVRDWKFGQTAAWWQMLVQCMAVAYGESPNDEPQGEVDAGFVFIDGETGGRIFFEDSRIVSLEEIDEACDKLFAAWDRVEQMVRAYSSPSSLKTTEGTWCTYCGAYDACPAKWAMSRAMLGQLIGDVARLPALTVEEKGALWDKTREAKRVIEDIQEALKGSALREGCLPLPSGKFLTMIECAGRISVDKTTVVATIKRLGGGESDIKGVLKQGRGYLTPKELNKRSEP